MKKVLQLSGALFLFSLLCLGSGYAQQLKNNDATRFYVNVIYGDAKMVSPVSYASATLGAPGDLNIIKSRVPNVERVAEGTMDDNGIWWGVYGIFGVKKGISGFNGRYILKIDKKTGNVLDSVLTPDYSDGVDTYSQLCVGIAYNPADKLIYFLTVGEGAGRPALSKSGNSISKIESSNIYNFYSLNPNNLSDIRLVKSFGSLGAIGLACTNDGTFFTATSSPDDTLYIAKFTTGSKALELLNVKIDEENTSLDLIDLETDRNTNKVYMLYTADSTVNKAASKLAIASRVYTKLKLVDQSTGQTQTVYTFEKNKAACGLAFDYTPVVAGNGKLSITAPNGNEKIKGGSYYNINWRKTGGIVYGTIQIEYSLDGGVTWVKINKTPIAGLTRYSWSVPKVNSTNCLVRVSNYTTHQVFDVSDKAFTITTTTGVKNYPNPFNPSTKIVFGLENKAQVSLKVFNSIGQQVAELVNKQLEAGNHEYEFNASNLTSGVYFYNLSIDGKSQVNKMILMK